MKEQETVSWEDLPELVLHCVLHHESFSWKEINSLSLCSKHLYQSIWRSSLSNQLWRVKFKQEYKRLGHLSSSMPNEDWGSIFKSRIRINKRIKQLLFYMSSVLKSTPHLTEADVQDFYALSDFSEWAKEFIVDELISIDMDDNRERNLNIQYYAEKVLQFMNEWTLRKMWHHLRSIPEKEMILEKGAYFIYRWQNPKRFNYSYSDLDSRLEQLKERALNLLKQSHPRHPIFKATPESFENCRTTELTDNMWSPSECREIMDVASEVIFKTLPKAESYPNAIAKQFFFEELMRDMSLNVLTFRMVLYSLLRRLGVKTILLNDENHFILSWSETYCPESTKLYFDMGNQGKLTYLHSCPGIMSEHLRSRNLQSFLSKIHNAVEFVQVASVKSLYFTVRCLDTKSSTMDHLRSGLELVLLCRPEPPILSMMSLIDFNSFSNVIAPSLVHRLADLPGLEPFNINFPEFRSFHYSSPGKDDEKWRKNKSDVRYAVGMIMEVNNGKLCVITDWMISHDLPEPVYTVIMEENGSHRMAKQSQLKPIRGEHFIDQRELGKHFVRWCGNHYALLKHKADLFPEDEQVREHILGHCNKCQRTSDPTSC